MGIGVGSVLVPWRPFFWNAAEVVVGLLKPAVFPGGASKKIAFQRLVHREISVLSGVIFAAELSKPDRLSRKAE